MYRTQHHTPARIASAGYTVVPSIRRRQMGGPRAGKSDGSTQNIPPKRGLGWFCPGDSASSKDPDCPLASPFKPLPTVFLISWKGFLDEESASLSKVERIGNLESIMCSATIN